MAPPGPYTLTWARKLYSGSISGNVKSTNGSQNIGGIQVDAYLADGTPMRTTTTDGSGNYTLPGWAPAPVS